MKHIVLAVSLLLACGVEPTTDRTIRAPDEIAVPIVDAPPPSLIPSCSSLGCDAQTAMCEHVEPWLPCTCAAVECFNLPSCASLGCDVCAEYAPGCDCPRAPDRPCLCQAVEDGWCLREL